MNRFQQQDNLLGESNSFLEVLEHVSRAAPLNKPVLIIGERGTGKELIAERIHFLSQRWDQSFVKLNCASLNENLLESELFGYEAGAFTGAAKRHQGRFERANGGSLFLDELANTSGLIQEKLLRVIEYGEFERVGGSKTIKTDVRLVAATNEDLPHLAEIGEFRADLLDRLAFDVITLPPLRERREDILLLAEYFAINMCRQMGLEMFSGFTKLAKETLMDHPWHGNIRELKNTIERSVYRLNSPHLPLSDIVLDPFDSPYRPKRRSKTQDRIPSPSPASQQPEADAVTKTEEHLLAAIEIGDPSELPAFPMDLKEHLQAQEITLIRQALAHSQFNQRKTATSLGLTYHQFRGILKKYNLFDELK